MQQPPPSDAPAAPDAHEVWQLEMQLQSAAVEGRHELAAPLAERLLELRESSFGADHPATLTTASGLAESYIHLSQWSRAEALLERVLRAREAHAAEGPAELAGVLNQLAKLHRRAGAIDRVEPLLRRALDLLSTAPERDFDTFAEVAHNLAHLLDDRGGYAEAEKFCRTGLEIRQKLFGNESAKVAESLNTLALLRRHQDDLDEAERLYLRAIAITEALDGREHRNLVVKLANLGLLYNERQDPKRAIDVLTRALSILEASEAPPLELLGSVLDNLATSHELVRDDAAALSLARRAVSVREELLGPDHPDVATSLNNLAIKLALVPEGRAEATDLLRRAIRLREATQGSSHPLLGQMLQNLATFRFADGHLDEAEALAQRSLGITQRAEGMHRLESAATLAMLAELARRRGDLDRAAEHALAALRIRQQHLGKKAGDVFKDVMRVGEILAEMEEHEEARKTFELAAEIAERALNADPEKLSTALMHHGHAALGEKKPKLALMSLRRAATLREKALGASHPDLADLWGDLGKANLELGKYGAAEEAYGRMRKAYEATYTPDDAHRSLPFIGLAEVAEKRKNHRRAAELYEEALGIAEKDFGAESLRLQVLLDRAAEAWLAAGELERAKELSSRLLRLLEPHVDPDDPVLLPAVRKLADIEIRKKTDVDEIKRLVEWSMRLLERLTEQTNAETAEMRRKLARQQGAS